ncbi:MAG: DUF3352 domain-containing protein [bacterium]|nr:DUF3352 domain-containing protein [bacterium]
MDSYDEFGSVRPVSGQGEKSYMDPIQATAGGPRKALVGGLVLAVLIVAAVAATVVWRGRTGDPFASARSVPAEIDFVMTFDALALSDSERLQAFVDAFAVPMLDAELIDSYPGDLVAAIDETMAEETGFTLTDDIVPWIGRSVSIAGKVPELDFEYGSGVEISFILSADVRDRAAAEAFVDKVVRRLGDEQVTVTASEIAGQPGYLFTQPDAEPEIALVLLDDALLVGTDDSVAGAIAARDAGLSIAEDAGFVEVMSRLPEERMVAYYVAPSAMNALLDLSAAVSAAGFAGEIPELPETPEATPMAAAVSLVDEGVLFSYVSLGTIDVGDVLAPDNAVLGSLPDSTLGFLSIAGSFGSEGMSLDEQMMSDLGYPLGMLSQETGIDMVAVLESLSGGLTIAVNETRSSSIAAATDVPVGVLAAVDLNDSEPISGLLDMLEEMAGQQGVELSDDAGVTTISVDGDEYAAYSLADDLLVIGSGSDLVRDVASNESGGLLSSQLYVELDAGVAGDGLVMFVDIDGIVSLVPLTSDEAAVIAPIRGMGVGGEVDGDAVTMEVLLLVDY